jgi:hypothetical protein
VSNHLAHLLLDAINPSINLPNPKTPKPQNPKTLNHEPLNQVKQELVAERTKTTRVLQGAEDERDAKRGLVDSLGDLKRELIRYLFH